jgi:phosphoserine phosphatase
VRSAYKALRGLEAAHYYALIDDFVAHELASRIYPEMVREIRAHQEAGRVCVVVTTGAEALALRAVALFPPGVDVIGCRLEERDGCLTGRVDGPLYGADKANIIRAYCRAAGISPADCWAYTDHYSDYHMLDAVGHGVVVNPRGRLKVLAEQRGWRLMTPVDPRRT